MAIMQVSERVIRNEFLTLDSYLNKTLSHSESDLFYNDGMVYKILSKIYRLHRQRYMWILDQNKFNNCLNIESLLYQGDKLIGCTTKFQEDLNTLKYVIQNNEIDIYDAKKIFEILINVHNQLLNYDLCYADQILVNIGIKQGQVLLTDLDGVYYKPDKTLINWSYINFYRTYLCMLLNENLYQYDERCLKEILGQDISLDILKKHLSDVTKMQVDVLKENLYIYKKTLVNDKINKKR